MLHGDSITTSPEQSLDRKAGDILFNLDPRSLHVAELVCKEQQQVISQEMLWKKLIERMVGTDPPCK